MSLSNGPQKYNNSTNEHSMVHVHVHTVDCGVQIDVLLGDYKGRGVMMVRLHR